MEEGVGINILEAESISRQDVVQLRKKIYTSQEEKENLEKEVERLSQAVKRTRDPVKIKDEYQEMGIILWLLGRVKEAAEALEEVKSRKSASYYLGRCYQELGEYEKALDYLEKTKREGVEEFDLEMDIVETKRKAGMHKEALKRVEQLSKTYGEEAELHYQWGCCLEDMGEYQEAVAHHEKALVLNPEHASALFRLAFNYDLEGEDDKAVEYYERCKALNPTFTNVLINLGTLYEDRGEYGKAVSCFETALRADPDNSRAALYLKDAKDSLDMYYDEEKIKAQDKESETLNIPISDFELSVRSKNCLERMNIRSLKDLTMVTEQDLLSYKNFGETSLNEIKAMLSQKGLRLGQAVEDKAKLKALSLESGDELLSRPISTLELSARSTKALEKMGIGTIGELISSTEEEFLSQKNFRKWYLDEIKEKLGQYGLSLKEKAEK